MKKNLLSFISVVTVLFAASGCKTRQFNAEELSQVFEVQGLMAGEKALDFVLSDVRNPQTQISLKSLLASHKALVLVFTDFGSGFLKSVEKSSASAKEFQSKGVAFLAVSQNCRDLSSAKKFAEENAWLSVVNDCDVQDEFNTAGKVTFQYTKEFRKGSSPRQNLFIIRRDLIISHRGDFPGTPEKKLRTLLESAIL